MHEHDPIALPLWTISIPEHSGVGNRARKYGDFILTEQLSKCRSTLNLHNTPMRNCNTITKSTTLSILAHTQNHDHENRGRRSVAAAGHFNAWARRALGVPLGLPLRERGGRRLVRRQLQPRAFILPRVTLRMPVKANNAQNNQHHLAPTQSISICTNCTLPRLHSKIHDEIYYKIRNIAKYDP